MPSGSSSRSERLRLWLERGESGYWLRDAATGDAVRWDDERLRVVKLAGASYRSDALQDDAFAPGRRLALVREPENEHDPNAVGIWDAERRLQAGYVPAEVAPSFAATSRRSPCGSSAARPAPASACASCSPRRMRGSRSRARDDRTRSRSSRRRCTATSRRALPPVLTVEPGDRGPPTRLEWEPETS